MFLVAVRPDGGAAATRWHWRDVPYATHALASGGGLATNLAFLSRRFWAIAARVNSSCAPSGPRITIWKNGPRYGEGR